MCTSCGAVSSDYFPYPTVGDPVLPPAHCTVVVGLDVLVEDARGPTDPPSGGPPGSSGSPPEQTGSPPAEMGRPPASNGSPPDEPGSPPTGRGSALGWMPGFGYLDPDHVRKIAIREGSVWQRLVADPLSGHAVSVSPFTYRPTASLARFVRARDGVARDPGCGSFGATEAERCELDHIVPFDVGGTTTADNLQALSRRGHTRKTKRQWEVTGDAGGSLRWTSLAGKRYTSDPLDYRDF
ncbi:HNH endonuclease [Kytococcus sedentarius]|nr:HNH endonuclease [Kytococcus sedentarius]